MITWKNETRKLSDLIPANYNPRKLEPKERQDLEASIRQFSAVEPVVINIGARNNVLIGGHQRIKIYADLGYEQIDVRVPDRELTLDEEKNLNLRLNKNTGSWDIEKLAEMDKELLALIGFNNDELTKIFDIKETKDDSFDPGAAMPAEPKTKLGDIYQIGPHRLLCGDATIEDDVAKLMDGRKAQMTFTDPPYNVDYTGGMGAQEKNARDGILNDKMEKGQFYEFLQAVCENIVKYCQGGVYICMSSSELETLKKAFEDSGGHWQTYVVWVKNVFTLSRSDYQHIYEPILYGWPADIKNHYFNSSRDIPNVWEDLREIKTTFDGQHTTIKFQGFEVKIKGKAEGEVKRRKQKTDIWRYDKPTVSKEHPTMKPVALCAEAIKNSSRIGDTVLDLFLGSGSTMVAAQRTDRICYGLELDPKFCDVIVRRMHEAFPELEITKNGTKYETF
jgi:DNA modification methylase